MYKFSCVECVVVSITTNRLVDLIRCSVLYFVNYYTRWDPNVSSRYVSAFMVIVFDVQFSVKPTLNTHRNTPLRGANPDCLADSCFQQALQAVSFRQRPRQQLRLVHRFVQQRSVPRVHQDLVKNRKQVSVHNLSTMTLRKGVQRAFILARRQ